MARKAQSKRKAAEREAIQAARIGGRYAIVAALIAAVVGAVVTAALTNLFGLLASPSDRAGQLGGSPAKGVPGPGKTRFSPAPSRVGQVLRYRPELAGRPG
jgi:hypothetical protein